MLGIKIETERLVLRAFNEDDSKALFDIFSDPEVMKYWNTPPWRSLDDAAAFINNSSDSMCDSRGMTLGVYKKHSGELLGKVMLFNYDKESKRAEIGFGISQRYWGKGIVSEAGTALIKFAFNTLGLRRIEAEIDPENVSSANVLERMGFIKEGLLRQRWEVSSVISDSALYGLLAEDLKAREQQI